MNTEKPLDVYHYTRKFHALLRNRPEIFHLKKMKKNAGLISEPVEVPNKKLIQYNRIEIDPRENILSVLVHEMIHYFYPLMTEPRVRKLEAKIINKLSERQATNLLKALAAAL